MGVVEPDDGQGARTSVASCVDVGLRVDLETVRRVVCDIRTANRREDPRGGPDQQAAALGGKRLAGVRRDVLEHGGSEANRYDASTAMAIPIPPPMHSDATP